MVLAPHLSLGNGLGHSCANSLALAGFFVRVAVR